MSVWACVRRRWRPEARVKHRIVIQQHRPWQSPMLVAGGACLLAVAGWGLYSYTRASTVSDFERAQLELAAPGPLAAQDAADWIEKGIRLVQEALGA